MNKEIAEFGDIKEIAGKIYNALRPCRVYLFGSFAKGTQNADSDYDFYVIVDDDRLHPNSLASDAYYAVGINTKRELDIVVARNGLYENRKMSPASVEFDVCREGVLLYE